MEDKPTPVGCGLENLDDEIMRRDDQNLDIYISLCHGEERFDMSEHPNPTITIEESHETSSLAGHKA